MVTRLRPCGLPGRGHDEDMTEITNEAAAEFLADDTQCAVVYLRMERDGGLAGADCHRVYLVDGVLCLSRDGRFPRSDYEGVLVAR